QLGQLDRRYVEAAVAVRPKGRLEPAAQRVELLRVATPVVLCTADAVDGTTIHGGVAVRLRLRRARRRAALGRTALGIRAGRLLARALALRVRLGRRVALLGAAAAAAGVTRRAGGAGRAVRSCGAAVVDVAPAALE